MSEICGVCGCEKGAIHTAAECFNNLKARAETAEAVIAAMLTTPALTDVMSERQRQDQKWGEQNHDPYVYMAILMEELGEMAQAALQTQFGGKHGGLDHLREDAVHTAAVALAIVECLDRKRWCWGTDAKEGENNGHKNSETNAAGETNGHPERD